MRNIFILPDYINLARAKRVWREKDELRHAGKATYIDDPCRVYKDFERSVLDVIRSAERSTTIVLWSIDQLNVPTGLLNSALENRKQDFILIRVLNPDLAFDPQSPDCGSLIELMAFQSNAPVALQEEKTTSASGNEKISDELIEKIKQEKYLGKTLREIAREYDISKTTVAKYTKGIAPIKREKVKQTVKRENKVFDYQIIQDDPRIKGTRLAQVVTEYIKSQRSFETKKHYFRDISTYIDWLIENKLHPSEEMHLNDFDMGHAYLEMLTKKYSPSTVGRMFKSIRNLLSYCVKRGYFYYNELEVIKLVKVKNYHVTTEPLESEELKLFLSTGLGVLNNPKVKGDSKAKAFRNFVGFYLLASCGMRIGALMSLRKMDVRTVYDQMILNLESKGDTYQVTLDKAVANVVLKYLDLFFSDEPDHAYLMFSSPANKTRALCPNSFNMIISRHAQKCRIKKKVSGHTFRTTFATQAYFSGITLKEIQKRLNHKRIEQTAAYIKFNLKGIQTPWTDIGEDIQLGGL